MLPNLLCRLTGLLGISNCPLALGHVITNSAKASMDFDSHTFYLN